MPFNAGDIEATLRVSRDEFNRALDQAKADAEKFSSKPITVKLKAEGVPEAKADLDKVAVAKEKLDAKPAVVKVKAEGTAETVAELGKVAQARDKAGRFTTVKVGTEGVPEVIADLDKVEAKKARAGRPVRIPVTADTRQADDGLDRVTAKVQGLADKLKNAGGPFWLGPALLSLGALGTSAGVAAGAVAGLGGAFTAGAGALAAFGAVAKPVLSGAEAAQKAAAAAQGTYNTAIGKAAAQYQVASGAAKTHAQQLTALAGLRKADATAASNQALTVKAAYAGMSQAQIDLSRQLGAMSQGWKDLQAAQAPVVAGALVPWLASVTSLTRQLPPIIAAVSPVIKDLGTKFGDLVNSQAFTRFRDFISSTGTATVSAAGTTIIDLVKSLITLLPQFDPLIREAVSHIADLGPAALKWSQSKQATDDIQKFMQWFNANGPQVGQFLKSIGGALAALAPGLTAGGTGELQVLTGFFNLIAKLPPSFARPIAEVAGWLLILNKLGVVSVGVKVIGAAAGWISKLISGATVTVAATAQQTAATAMQVAADTMVTAAAAMQRAADTMIGADAGAGKAGGAAGAGGKAAGAGAGAGAVSSGIGILGKAGIAAGGAAIAAGLILKVREDMKAGWNAIVRDIPTALSGVGGVLTLASQGWSDLLVKPVETHVRAFWQRVEHDFAAHFAEIRHDFARWTDDLLHVTASGFDRVRHAAATDLAALRHQAAVIFDGMRRETAHIWNIIYNNTVGAVIRMGKDAIARLRSGLISPFESGLKGAWNWLVANFGVPLNRFFTSTLPGYWNTAIGFLRSRFISPLESMFKGTWNWLMANFGTPIARWLTQTIPGYFTTAVTKVKSAWSGITNAFIGPARTVVNNVINPLIADADAVLKFVHLPLIPAVPKFAAGTRGAPPGWAWVGEQGPELIYMQGGEHVLPSPVSQKLAGAGMFPGYATGTPAAPAGGNPGGLGGVFGHVTGAISSALNWAKNLTLGALAATFTPAADALLNLMPKPTSGAEGMIEAIPRALVTDLIGFIKSKDPGAGVGGGSGADVANYAKTFATGLSHPYVLGGASPSGWDCSGFSAFVYEHFGYFPEHQGSRHGTSESQFVDPLTQSSGSQTGALVFFNDGIFANPGHVGIVLNPSAHVSASGTAVGTIIGSNAAAVGYRVPKGGFHAAGTSLGPGSANFAADITTVLRSMGLSLSLVPNWLSQIQTESGGNPGAVNRTDSNAQAGHPCVTMDTMILTRRGWLNYGEVHAGDETIGFNHATGRSEWTRITKVHYYDSAEVWRIGNSQWHADVTPNHRWVTERDTELTVGRGTACPECDREFATPRGMETHLGKAHHKRLGTAMVTSTAMTETRDLGGHDYLRLAAVADTDGIPGLSTEDAAILGWIMGDGHAQRAYRQPELTACPECGLHPSAWRKRSRGPIPEGQVHNSIAVHRAKAHGITGGGNDPARETDDAGWDVSIWQAKPEQVIRLRALLAHVPHAEHVRHRNQERGHLPEHHFKLTRAYGTDLLKRARYGEANEEELVLSLSPDQRAAWLAAMIDAEGHTENGYTRIAQNDGPVADAIRLAVYLEGWRPTFSRFQRRDPKHSPAGHIGMARPRAAVCMFTTRERIADQPVWCVSTVLGSWTMRQGNRVMLTGNSVGILQLIPSTFAAYAGPYRNTPPLVNFGGGFVSENIMAQIYAGIHYANARYGSNMANVIGHGHGYDEGGWLKPGATMVMNRTGRPEPVLTGKQWDKLTSAVAGNDVCARLDRIAGILASLPHATAAGVGDVINGTARAASLRARYPHSNLGGLRLSRATRRCGRAPMTRRRTVPRCTVALPPGRRARRGSGPRPLPGHPAREPGSRSCRPAPPMAVRSSR